MRARRTRGFTLVEVMVSVSILSMVGVMLYSTVAVTLNSQKTAERIHATYHAGWVAMSKMVRDLTNAFLSRHVSVMERNRETLFIGRDDRVLFTYLGHFRWFPEEPESDQGVVAYSVKSGQLMRREKTTIDDNAEKGGLEEVLVDGVKKLELQYWDAEQEDWVDEWKAEMEETDPVFLEQADAKAFDLAKKMAGIDELDEFVLPSRVRIRLTLVDEENREYPFESEAQLMLRHPLGW